MILCLEVVSAQLLGASKQKPGWPPDGNVAVVVSGAVENHVVESKKKKKKV